MVDESIIATVQNYLQTLRNHGLVVRFGIVFGAQATGKVDPWSDIDLLVVSPRFDDRYNRQEVDLLWRLAARIDSRIEPIPCGERQWQEDDSSAIVEIARREGERIVPPEES
jgi:predicted nucleotidyltransferase